MPRIQMQNLPRSFIFPSGMLLSKLSPVTAPMGFTGRESFGMAYDYAIHRVVIFAGLSNETAICRC